MAIVPYDEQTRKAVNIGRVLAGYYHLHIQLFEKLKNIINDNHHDLFLTTSYRYTNSCIISKDLFFFSRFSGTTFFVASLSLQNFQQSEHYNDVISRLYKLRDMMCDVNLKITSIRC